MSGRLICFVGPSGVGKDTVMAAYAARHDARLARRVITRPADAGGEDFDGVTPDAFARQQAAGAFALSWQAHGLSYGVPQSVRADLQAGRDVLANLSRAVLTQAAEVFPGMIVVHLTAADEILAARLLARGREDSADIRQRLARSQMRLPEGLNVIEIDNGGALAETLRALDDALARRKDPAT